MVSFPAIENLSETTTVEETENMYFTILVGMQTSVNTMKISVEVLQRVKIEYDISIP